MEPQPFSRFSSTALAVNTLSQRWQSTPPPPPPRLRLNSAQEAPFPRRKGQEENTTFQMNVLHYLKRTGGAGFKGITPARWNNGSLFGSESESGMGKGKAPLSLFPHQRSNSHFLHISLAPSIFPQQSEK